MKKLLLLVAGCTADIENPGLVEPSKCEACKYFTIELKVRPNFSLILNSQPFKRKNIPVLCLDLTMNHNP